ncbi:MAG: hypothetical protein JST20_10985 [Bacteroidetes bacterium]|nr:hypothetical protein [Bacteroidota bacterium]
MKILTVLFIVLMANECSAKITTSTTCKIVGTNLNVTTMFTNISNNDDYVLLNTWSLFCYSVGYIGLSRRDPNGNPIFIIPQSWNEDNSRIGYECEFYSPSLKSSPCYYYVPKQSKRRLSYTITFKNEKRMQAYLANTKLVLFYCYQTADDLDSVSLIFGSSFNKHINRSKELNLGNIAQIDVVKNTHPNSFNPDLTKDITYCENSDTITELQADGFAELPKKATELEIINLFIPKRKK